MTNPKAADVREKLRSAIVKDFNKLGLNEPDKETMDRIIDGAVDEAMFVIIPRARAIASSEGLFKQ